MPSADCLTGMGRPDSLPRMRSVPLLVGVLILGAACHRDEITTGVDDSAYVHVMIDLRGLATSPADSMPHVRARDSVLRTYDLTIAQLESATVSLSHDPVRAGRIWQAIEQRQVHRLP